MVCPLDDMETPQPSQLLEAKQDPSFKMVDVGAKRATSRKAWAQGQIFLTREAFVAIRDRTNPKGDVLALAEVTGLLAAKSTSNLIPLCHPLPLEQVTLRFILNESDWSVITLCEVATFAKTGVEMEALSGVNGALLTIYDLSKAVNPVLSISNIRLNRKDGGKAGTWIHPQAPCVSRGSDFEVEQSALKGIRSAVITISDRCFQMETEDASGPVLVKFLNQNKSQLVHQQGVPDHFSKIQDAIKSAIDEKGAQLVITTGGTGLGPRDVTPEAIQGIADKIIPGIGERLRSDGARSTPLAYLSRSLGVLIGNSLVIALPGSPKAVEEGLQALKDLLPHALHIARGGPHHD